ncbi:hypothetical protein [Priestia flexa]|uniref:hypothetical protein n=1 Tax=Priestia flexa TaxID=86664 RepID=UPI0009705E79|nr:hypothetical protein [Priestia flexa]MEC0667073.1 hypothetical protein [Priestia flexa]
MANKLTTMTKLVAIKGRLRKKVTSLATGQTKIGLYFYKRQSYNTRYSLKSVTKIKIYVTGG